MQYRMLHRYELLDRTPQETLGSCACRLGVHAGPSESFSSPSSPLSACWVEVTVASPSSAVVLLRSCQANLCKADALFCVVDIVIFARAPKGTTGVATDEERQISVLDQDVGDLSSLMAGLGVFYLVVVNYLFV